MKNVGLVLVQATGEVAHQPLMSGISHGLEETFVRAGMRMVTRVVRSRQAELEVYRHWRDSSAVEAVVLVRVAHHDERVEFLGQLGVPFVAIVDVGEVDDFAAVTIDSASMMRSALAYLKSRGAIDIVYVKSEGEAILSEIRERTFLADAAASHYRGRVVTADLTRESASETARSIAAARAEGPTAIIFEDDVMAVVALETVRSLGVDVPRQISIMAWNDSVRCQSTSPSITALSDEAHQIGSLAATCLIDSVASGKSTVVHSPDSFIVQRASA